MPSTYENGRICEKNIIKKKFQLKVKNDINKDIKVILRIDKQIQSDLEWNKYFNNNKINDDNNQNLIFGKTISHESNIKKELNSFQIF